MSNTEHHHAAAPRHSGVVFWPLVAIVSLAPLPFASVTVYAWAPLASATAAILALWSALLVFGVTRLSVSPTRFAIPGLLFAGAIIWICLQIAPFTPASWHHPVWPRAAEVLSTKLPGSVTLDRFATASALARLLWYAAIFWLALQLCRNADAARRALGALALAAFLYAAYGLAIEFSGARMVLWMEKFAYLDSVTSTFINRNSYATYAGIGLIALTAAIVRKLTHQQGGGGPTGNRVSAGVVFLFEHAWHLLLAWAVVVTALFLTDSRAGVVSSLIGLIAFLLVLASSRTRARRAFIWGLVPVLAVLVGFFAISGDVVGKRLVRTLGATDLRFEIYDVTLNGISKYPLLGTGYGTYRQAFELLRPERFSHGGVILRAHNTYLENALELGIPAAALLTLSVVLLAIICLRGVRRRRTDAFYPALGVGVTVLVGLHSLVDFSLQMPAVSVTYAFIMGIACAQSWSSRDGRTGVAV